MRILLALLFLIAASETGFLAWYFGFRPARPPTAATTEAVPQKAQPANPEQIAVAAEQSVLDSIPLPSPTPGPATSPAAPAPPRRVATPESQVAELIDLARTLRDRGDTGTAMARLRDAQAIFPQYAPIISEMALTYEKMGLTQKALEQWRRIYEMGEKAGIYYAAADAKLRALQLPDAAPGEPAPAASPADLGGLLPGTGPKPPPAATGPALSLVNVGTLDDTGNTQPLRRLKLRVPIQARAGAQVDPRDVVIQVFFYDQLKDGSIVETNASVISSWARRTTPSGDVLPVDWSSPEPEVLEVDYAQRAFDPKDPDTREHRNYFGYCVRVYYKGVLESKFADPARLLTQFIPPVSLPTSDLPR